MGNSFTPAELRRLRSLKDPHGIQRLLDAMPYHLADTAWSPRRVLRENTSHCFEGATFAAAALRANGYSPLVLDLEADHDTDHVIAIYRHRGHWGAVAKSNYTGCRYREPVYRTLRELALSYFEVYFNLRRERTLRTFSRPVNSGLKPAPNSSNAANRPWRSMVPVDGSSVPQASCRKVDLPAPLRPIRPTASPRPTSRLTCRRAQNSS